PGREFILGLEALVWLHDCSFVVERGAGTPSRLSIGEHLIPRFAVAPLPSRLTHANAGDMRSLLSLARAATLSGVTLALALGCGDAGDGNDSGANQGPGTDEATSPAGGGCGSGVTSGKGYSTQQFQSAAVSRNGVDYILITNGWGSGFRSHEISWDGTSFLVESTDGPTGTNWQPASFPTVFCGKYSVPDVPNCGLPVAIASAGPLRTGWRWAPNGNNGQYNASYDIWVGDGNNLQG